MRQLSSKVALTHKHEHTPLSRKQRDLIEAGAGQLAQLDPADLRPNPWGNILHFRILSLEDGELVGLLRSHPRLVCLKEWNVNGRLKAIGPGGQVSWVERLGGHDELTQPERNNFLGVLLCAGDASTSLSGALLQYMY